MKQYRKPFFAALIVVLLATVLLLPVAAETTDMGGDQLIFDVEEVKITDGVDGDLLAFAVGLTVQGEVQGSIRAFASEVLMDSKVHRNVTVGGSIVECGDDFSASAVVLAGGQILFTGECDTLSITGDTVYIGGTVHGELVCDANRIILLEGAEFASAKLTASSEPVVAKSETDTDYRPLSEFALSDRVKFEKTESQIVSELLELPFSVIGAVALALLVSLLFGRAVDRAVPRFRAHPVPFCLKGLAALFVIPFAAIFLLLMLPSVTLPISGALALIFFLLWLVSDALTASILGRVLLKRWNPYAASAFVAAIIAVVSVIPFVAGLVSFFCMLVSFGFTVSMLFTRKEAPQDLPMELDMDFRV